MKIAANEITENLEYSVKLPTGTKVKARSKNRDLTIKMLINH